MKSLLPAIAFAVSLATGVSCGPNRPPTFPMNPAYTAEMIWDWKRANHAENARVKIVPSPQGQTLVAIMPDGKIVTEVINPSDVIVRP